MRPPRFVLIALLAAALAVAPGSRGASAGSRTLAARASALGLQCSQHTPSGAPAFTFCTGEIPSFDGIGLDTDLSIPTGATAPLPTVLFLHGWSQDKTAWEADSPDGTNPDTWHWNNVWFVSQGWVAVNSTARGFKESCGVFDSDANCADGYTHLAQREFEGRDSQTLLGKLVDAGIAAPTRIAATGDSYGGGQSWTLATSLPWQSPDGTEIQLAAAVPKYPWTDLLDSLLVSGRATDSPDQSRSHLDPLGVPKESYIDALYAVGRAVGQGRYDENPDHPGTNLDEQNALVQSGEPYDQKPDIDQIVASYRSRSPYYAQDYFDAVAAGRVREVPVFSIQGWTDPLFPAVQTLQMWRKLQAADPAYPVQMAFGDIGHSNAQNPGAQWHPINTLAWRFLQAHVLGRTGVAPSAQAYSFRTRCPASSKTQSPVAGTWDSLTRGVALASGGPATTTSADQNPIEGAQSDPIANENVCLHADDAQDDPLQAYDRWAAPATGFPLLGLPSVAVHYDLSGQDATVVFKLWDVAPGGSKTMVTRGVYRLSTAHGDPASGVLRTQLFGNDWLFPAGHVIELQVGQVDAPTWRPDNLPSSLAISSVHVRFPTHRAGTITLQPAA
ncbi:MAG: CocE/NonD family hydrolase [Actinomycetota bacterium]